MAELVDAIWSACKLKECEKMRLRNGQARHHAQNTGSNPVLTTKKKVTFSETFL